MKLSPPTRPSETLAASGVTTPTTALPPPRRRRKPFGLKEWFGLLVVLPTLLLAGYYVTYAADIYESEALFLVRNRGGGGGGAADAGGGGRTARMASAFVSAAPAAEESRAVMAYLQSPAAIDALEREIDLVSVWRAPEADVLAKLWWEQPQIEWMVWYFRRRVMVEMDPETSVMKLRVHAFRPQDAQRLAQAVMRASEHLVNTFTERSMADTIRVAQEDVAKAEQRVREARDALGAFREREQNFDPNAVAGSAVGNINALQGALTAARTELQERRAYLRPNSPQIQVLENRVATLQRQITTERGRVTRGDEALIRLVNEYEQLELERAFADRMLVSAVASLEGARSEAIRQQIFLVPVSDPHMPEFALYPRVTFNLLTVFVSLSVLFGIGWLLIVSAREHAN